MPDQDAGVRALPPHLRQLRRRVQGDTAVSAVLRLVRGDDGDGGIPPLEAFEIQMRGAGRSDRYVSDSIKTLLHLERFTAASRWSR
jgi:hypothetical protein